jgi:hypothetical protein
MINAYLSLTRPSLILLPSSLHILCKLCAASALTVDWVPNQTFTEAATLLLGDFHQIGHNNIEKETSYNFISAGFT